NRSSYSGTLLPGLYRHLSDDFFDKKIELVSAGRRVHAEHREIQRVGLLVEPDGVLDHRLTGLERAPSRSRAGERDGVLTRHVVEQIAGAATEQLDRAGGQDPRLDDGFDDRFSQERGDRGRLDDRRYAREECRREFLQHAPDGEIERVDLDRRAFDGHADVPTDERTALGEIFRRAIDVEPLIRKFAAAAAAVREQRAESAVDVDPRVALGCAGRLGDLVEPILAFHEILAEGFEHPGSVVERQVAQLWAAD